MSTQDPNPSSSPDPYGTPQAPRYDQGAPHGQNDPAHQGGYPAAPAYGGEQGLQGGAPKNGLGLAALIVGIVSLLIGIIPGIGVLGFVGIVAVVLGIVGLRRVKARVATNRGMALTGLILGILAIIAAIVWTVAIVFFAGTFGDTIQNCSDPSLSEAQVQQCIDDGINDTLDS